MVSNFLGKNKKEEHFIGVDVVLYCMILEDIIVEWNWILFAVTRILTIILTISYIYTYTNSNNNVYMYTYRSILKKMKHSHQMYDIQLCYPTFCYIQPLSYSYYCYIYIYIFDIVLF